MDRVRTSETVGIILKAAAQGLYIILGKMQSELRNQEIAPSDLSMP